MANARALIEVDRIETRFGSEQVHRGVSFRVEKPSVVAIIGGSGAGKSVLLRAILGLLRPYAGRAFLFGEDVWASGERRLNELRNRIGVLFQNGALFSGLTVAENVAVPLKEKGGLGAAVNRAGGFTETCLGGSRSGCGGGRCRASCRAA